MEERCNWIGDEGISQRNRGKKKTVPWFLVRVNCIVREVTRLYELHLESWMEINV